MSYVDEVLAKLKQKNAAEPGRNGERAALCGEPDLTLIFTGCFCREEVK